MQWMLAVLKVRSLFKHLATYVYLLFLGRREGYLAYANLVQATLRSKKGKGFPILDTERWARS